MTLARDHGTRPRHTWPQLESQPRPQVRPWLCHGCAHSVVSNLRVGQFEAEGSLRAYKVFQSHREDTG